MSKVYASRVLNYASEGLPAAIEAAFENSENAKKLTAQSRVLIKPNLLAKHSPNEAITTHPAVLRQVITALQRRGVTDITVADSPGGVYNPQLMEDIYKVCGIAQVCSELRVKMYTDCKWKSKSSQGIICREWNFIEPVVDADFIINLPKIKTHMMMGVSCAVKNMYGSIPGLQKAELHLRFPHKDNFAQMLVDMFLAAAPSLNIADGILAMEGDGPAGGTPKLCSVILSSDNAFLLDLAVLKLLGFTCSEVPYMQRAVQRGLCEEEFDLSKLQGDKLLPFADYKKPSGYKSVDFSGKVPKPFRPLAQIWLKHAAPKPVIYRLKCIGCGKCGEICPAKAINITDKKAHINKQKCIRCFCCHEVCPIKAIKVKSSKLLKL